MSTGKFVWFELMTKDVEKAEKFYSRLFGWTVKPFPMEGMVYNIFQIGEKGVGGMMAMTPDMQFPPHWLTYLEVDDVDAAAALTVKEGGSIAMPPMDIPNVGRFAVVCDPQGAYVAAFKSAPMENEQPNVPPADFEFSWNELQAADIEKAKSYYSKLVGCTYTDWDMGPMGKYYTWKNREGKDEYAGMMQIPPGQNYPSHWMAYVGVPNVDALADKAVGLGGKMMMPPMDVPDVGRFCLLQDPTGAGFALCKFVKQGC